MSYVFSVSFVDVSKSISIKRGHEQEEEFGILRREKMTKTSLPELSNLYQNFPISFDYQLMEQQEMLPEQHLQAKTIPSLHKMENYFFL
jgi:hypothetical protein